MEIKFHKDLKDFIWKLKPVEFKQLEQNILKEGIRDKLITWNGYMVDGHNRYKIAQKHDLDFEVIEMDFDNIDEVKDWIDANQIGRRNLTNDQWQISIGRRYNNEKKAEHSGFNQYSKEVDAKSAPTKTDKKLADEYQVSPRSIKNYAKKADKYEQLKKDKPELAEGINTGEMSFKGIKKKEKKEIIQKNEADKKETLNKSIENPVVIHHTSYQDFLETIEDESIDLLITDPPYSTDINDIDTFIQEWIDKTLPKIKSNGRAFICIGAYPKELQIYLNILMKQNKFIVDNPLIWTYRNTLGRTPNMKYNLNYQIILHLYSKDSDPLDNSITNEMFTVQDINAPDGRIGDRYHTWQKPDELARRLIKHASKENDKILDIFACTGTFLLMADKMNRKAIGCDISEENLKIAEKRGCKIV